MMSSAEKQLRLGLDGDTQGDCGDQPRASRSGHRTQWTSIVAMQHNLPRQGTQMRQIYELLLDHQATDEQIHLETGIRYSSVNPARGKLVELGLVYNTGQTALTTGGEKAILWRAREGGLEAEG